MPIDFSPSYTDLVNVVSQMQQAKQQKRENKITDEDRALEEQKRLQAEMQQAELAALLRQAFQQAPAAGGVQPGAMPMMPQDPNAGRAHGSFFGFTPTPMGAPQPMGQAAMPPQQAPQQPMMPGAQPNMLEGIERAMQLNPALTMESLLGSGLIKSLTESQQPVKLGATDILTDPRTGQRRAEGIGREPEKPDKYTLGQGQTRFEDGKVVASVSGKGGEGGLSADLARLYGADYELDFIGEEATDLQDDLDYLKDLGKVEPSSTGITMTKEDQLKSAGYVLPDPTDKKGKRTIVDENRWQQEIKDVKAQIKETGERVRKRKSVLAAVPNWKTEWDAEYYQALEMHDGDDTAAERRNFAKWKKGQ